jgi:hypothetical protein
MIEDRIIVFLIIRYAVDSDFSILKKSRIVIAAAFPGYASVASGDININFMKIFLLITMQSDRDDYLIWNIN